MYHCFLLIGFLITTGNAGPQEPLRSEACPCEPRLEIRVELNNVAAATVSDPFAFDDNIAPYLALREKHPDEFSVQEMYQDAVFRFGIEGHLKALVEEYRNLDLKHPGDPTYHYLFLRSLAGRDTAGAIRGLSDMLVENASFAPAHRTLAGIYGSPAFRDLGKQKSEQEKFLALCPGSTLASRYRPAPDPSPKLEQAERLLAGDGDCDRIIALTIEALKEDEWRNQRIRAVDWYSVDYKRQNLRELREEYWKAWSIQVHALRKAGRLDKCAELLASMEQSAAAVRRDPGAYWNALATLARLYGEAKQGEQAAAKLKQMEQLSSDHPDAQQTAVLEGLRKLIK